MSNHESKPQSTHYPFVGGYGRAARVVAGLLLIMITLLTGSRATAQDSSYYPRSSTYVPFTTAEPVKYNLKFGNLTARLTGNVQVEASDNINLAHSNPVADLSISPYLGVGFLYPLSKNQVLSFDVGLGYRWYLKSGSVSSFSVVPNSHLEYTMSVEDVRFRFHDNFGVQIDPLSRADVSGTNSAGGLFRFQIFNNDMGVSADWQPFRNWVFNGAFDWALSRSLVRDFDTIDHDDYTFGAGVDYIATPTITVGVTAAYTLTYYVLSAQNDGSSYSVGPHVFWKVTKYITASASAGWTDSSFQQTAFNQPGNIHDTSQFGGITYQGAISHKVNSRTSQEIRFSRTAPLGYGSNFDDIYDVQYGLRTKISSGVSLNGLFTYEHFRASNVGGDEGVRYIFYLGSGYQITKLWHVGIGYSYAIKESNQPFLGYAQNRLTLDFSRQF